MRLVSHFQQIDLKEEEIQSFAKWRELINPASGLPSRWLLGFPAGYEPVIRDSKIVTWY
jgi:hypothetical protein